MTASIFHVGAPGVDVERVVREIREAVARKAADGAYADARVARAERFNLVNLRDDEDFLGYYLRSLREAAAVDINDFEIRERRTGPLAPLLVRVKRAVWSLLKFYTYRLWSQQNAVNSLLVTGLETLDEKHGDSVRRLEARVAELERQLAARGGPPAA